MNIKKTKGYKALRNLIKGKPQKKEFVGSKEYWENRYVTNRDSGSGSYGRLASFKAEILNAFVKNNSIKTILEFGSGDGNQLTLSEYPQYTGVDVSKKAIAICEEKFKNDKTKRFVHSSLFDIAPIKAELVMSLDVLYHLVEDTVFKNYMIDLFNASTKYVVIYSSNYDDHFAAHVKCREFTKWIDTNVADQWKQVDFIKNKYPFDKKDPNNTSMADFYFYQKII
ncbi:methyltransferase domain-containing protein [Patiriisocius marinistellae]|nr:methyltransferase domain-containing protein [Patiriisocius marinistellae]